MATMARVTINWTGFPGGPGYTNLYFRDFTGSGEVDQAVVDGAVLKADAFLSAVRPLIPTTITVGVDPTVESVEETTGELQGFFTAAPAAAAVGSGGTSYAGPAGAVISWYTSIVRNGRRVRGRTFIVPAGTGSFDTDGTITSTRLANLNTGATALIDPTGTGDLGIWARPTPILDANGEPTGAYNADGVWGVVNSFRIPDKAAVLTSRRD